MLYTLPQSVGLAGGRPSSSYYFVGVELCSRLHSAPQTYAYLGKLSVGPCRSQSRTSFNTVTDTQHGIPPILIGRTRNLTEASLGFGASGSLFDICVWNALRSWWNFVKTRLTYTGDSLLLRHPGAVRYPIHHCPVHSLGGLHLFKMSAYD
jgi:hypothetical protein